MDVPRRCLFNILLFVTFIFLKSETLVAQSWHFLGLETESISTIVVDHQNNNILYAGSRSNFSEGKHGKIFKSLNGGATWDTLLYGVDVGDIIMHPDNSNILYAALLMANFSPPGIIKTVDGGNTWFKADEGIRVDFETGVQKIAIDPKHPDTLYAGTSGFFGGTLYRSVDAGETWKDIGGTDTVYDPGDPDIVRLKNGVTAIAIHPESTNVVYAGTAWHGDVLKTIDWGQSWQLTGLSEKGIIYALLVDARVANIVYAGTWFYGFFKTVDGGLQWQACNNGLPDTVTVGQIIFNPSNFHELYILAAATRNTGGIFKTLHRGLSWQRIDTPFHNILTIAFSSDGKTLYAGTRNGIYKTVIITSIKNYQDKTSFPFYLYQNYPNPFNSSTFIRYELSSPEKVTLKVFNLFGQEIKTLIDEKQYKGSYVAKWDGKDNQGNRVAIGIYIFRLSIGSYTESKKMLYLR